MVLTSPCCARRSSGRTQPVSNEPDREFTFPTGRAWAADLDYPIELLARVPETSCESFAGVANPFSLARFRPGEDVLDIGCGAGMDTLVGAQMVGPAGTVRGIDMTPDMVAKARRSVAAMGLTTVTIVEGSAERLPFPDANFDVVISNGVIDLIPDRSAFEDTRRKAEKFGARGTTVKASKPAEEEKGPQLRAFLK
jgi:arsenite methyltransferase